MKHVDEITPRDCSLRSLDRADLEEVRRWRNADHIRRAMYSQRVISAEEHRAWFERINADPSQRYLVFEQTGRPAGIVCFNGIDLVHLRATWGFYVGDDKAPPGTGTRLGIVGLDYAFNTLGLHRIMGEVLASNQASLQFHRRLGFVEEGCMRSHALIDGRFVDVVRFGLLAPEWGARRSILVGSDPTDP